MASKQSMGTLIFVFISALFNAFLLRDTWDDLPNNQEARFTSGVTKMYTKNNWSTLSSMAIHFLPAWTEKDSSDDIHRYRFVLEAKEPLYSTPFRLYAVRAVQKSTEFTGGEDNANSLLEMFCQMLYKLKLLV